VNAPRTDESLMIPGSQTHRPVVPGCAIPTSNWNNRMLGRRMISLEDGPPLTRTLDDLFGGSIQLASGILLTAILHNLSGAVDVDLRYDETWTWVSMALIVVDDSEVRYERL
jgi:hypothetical protein